MANKVEISIETDLGDTLVKLRAVRDAIKDIHDKTVEIQVKTDQNRGFGFTSTLQDTEQAARSAEAALSDLAQATDKVTTSNDESSVAVERHTSMLTKLGTAGRWAEGKLASLATHMDNISAKINRSMNGRWLGPLGAVLGAPFDLIGGAINAGRKIGNFVQGGFNLLGGLFGGGAMGESAAIPGMTAALESLGAAIGPVIGGLSALGLAVGAVMVVITGAILIWNAFIAVLNTLADTIGSVVALMAAAAGPVGVFALVLGGIAMAAVIGFQHAMAASGKHFQAFRNNVEGLKDGFVRLAANLAHDFMPWFMQVAHVAQDVLNYFIRLSEIAGKSGLQGVFKSLANGGFARLNNDFLSLIRPIGNVISQVIGFAFGRGGAVGERLLTQDFNRFVTWLSGIANPIEKWFDKQHLMKAGMDLAHDVIDSPQVRSAIVNVADFLFKTFLIELQRALGPKRWNELKSALQQIKTTAEQFSTIMNTISGLFQKVGGMGTVFKLTMLAIKIAAEGIGTALSALTTPINAAISAAQTLYNILSAVASIAGSGGPNNFQQGAGRIGGGTYQGPTTGPTGPSHGGFGAGIVVPRGNTSMIGGNTIVINNASLSTPEQERATAARLQSLLNKRRIGGGS